MDMRYIGIGVFHYALFHFPQPGVDADYLRFNGFTGFDLISFVFMSIDDFFREAFGQGRHVLFGLETGRQLNWPPRSLFLFLCFLAFYHADNMIDSSLSLSLSFYRRSFSSFFLLSCAIFFSVFIRCFRLLHPPLHFKCWQQPRACPREGGGICSDSYPKRTSLFLSCLS
uniref:Uncharacterized protein n=1 Tax=Bionectria ochroleuca TaxID=29856 RepID=A0A8H7K8Q4_BIOOC